MIYEGTTYEEEAEIKIDESFSFDLSTLRAATNNFSTDNKLGEGGFGPVYKVTVNQYICFYSKGK